MIVMPIAQDDPVVSRHDRAFGAVARFLAYIPRQGAQFPTLYTEPYFEWKIGRNPFGASACLLRAEGGRAVSHCSYTAKPANPSAEIGAVVEVGDTHTHPSGRGRGHFAVLGRLAAEESIERARRSPVLVYGLPNDQALPGWTRRCGFDVLTTMHVFEAIRSPRTGFAAWLRRGAVSRELSMTVVPRKDADRFGHEIDALWAKAEGVSAWLVRKDGAWWRWRYVEASERYVTVAFRHRRSGLLVAYAVVKPWWRFRRFVQLCDLFVETEERSVEAFRLLLRGVIRVTDTALGWFQSGTPLAAEAEAAGFVRRRDVPVVVYKNDAYARLAADGRQFRLALGDTDNV